MFLTAALMQGCAHALKLNAGHICRDTGWDREGETLCKIKTGRQSSRCQAVVCLLSLTLSALSNDYLNPHSALSALCIYLTDLWTHGTQDVLFCTEPAIDSFAALSLHLGLPHMLPVFFLPLFDVRSERAALAHTMLVNQVRSQCTLELPIA